MDASLRKSSTLVYDRPSGAVNVDKAALHIGAEVRWTDAPDRFS